jgi:hypothetical protein
MYAILMLMIFSLDISKKKFKLKAKILLKMLKLAILKWLIPFADSLELAIF